MMSFLNSNVTKIYISVCSVVCLVCLIGQIARSRQHRSHRRASRHAPLWFLVLGDILLIGLALCVFALYQHVIPRMNARSAEPPKPIAVVTPSPAPVESPAPSQLPDDPEPTETPEPEPTDDRTPWQKKFADHFTDEIVRTDHSYSSPDISIEITTVVEPLAGSQVTYYVADIYVAQIENFQTYLAGGEYAYYAAQTPEDISRDAGALLAVNGDYCDAQFSGFFVRNGQLYMDDLPYYDTCVLFSDGTMETLSHGELTVDEILARSPYQIWNFGPSLLDNEGQPITSFPNTSMEIQWRNPRTGLGYYEPGHYCFVVADGRQAHSCGFDLTEFAQLFRDLGCIRAYNMDGGASSVMVFDGERITRPSGDRDLGDILLIKEIEK